jgi:serine/threonine-protein kinase
VDGRTDVYALGVVLYECLTGHKPFEAQTLPAIAVMIHEGKYEPLRTTRPDAPPELEAVIARAVHVLTEKRYATAAELAQALASIDLSASIGVGHTLVAPPTALAGTPVGLVDTAGGTIASQPDSISAGTGAGVETPSRPERHRSLKVGWLVAAGVLLVGGVLVVVGELSKPATTPTGENPVQPVAAPTLEEERIEERPRKPSVPTVDPIVSGGEPAPRATASVPVPSAKPSQPVVPEQRAGPSPPASSKPTRATQEGLIEDNPF